MFQDNDSLATISDSVREYVYNVGSKRKDEAWILTPYDTWEKNPFYTGPKVPHPEDWMENEYNV